MQLKFTKLVQFWPILIKIEIRPMPFLPKFLSLLHISLDVQLVACVGTLDQMLMILKLIFFLFLVLRIFVADWGWMYYPRHHWDVLFMKPWVFIVTKNAEKYIFLKVVSVDLELEENNFSLVGIWTRNLSISSHLLCRLN